MQTPIFHYIIISFSAAIVAVMAQLIIPLPLIPMTGQTLAIGLVATILTLKQSVQAVSLYVLIGAIGLPVYQSFTGGLGILFGPTGGFLFSFIPTAFIITYYLQSFGYTKFHAISANLIGMLINLSLGSVWLKYYLKIDFAAAFLSGFAPFLIVGILKAILAGIFGITIRQRLIAAKLLKSEI